MTLATRVIGTLLMDGGTGQLVHREHFKTLYPRNPPVTQARIYALRGMDEICLLDVTATEQGREPDYDLISEVVAGCFLPVSYGGGITSVEQATRIVAECGADKVVIATCFGLLPQIGERLGRQAVVASVDVPPVDPDAAMTVAVLRAVTFANDAGEILLQSIDRDGTLSGYNLDLVRSVSRAVSIPVIASSGCGSPQHMVDAMKAGASAVAAGWAWDATDMTPLDAKLALREAGYTVRIPEVNIGG